MKKRLYLICIAAFFVIAGITSCDEDFLTRDNPNATTDELFWVTGQDLLNAINSFGNGVLPHGAYVANTNSRISIECTTDNAAWSANYFSQISALALGNATSADLTGTIANCVSPLWNTDFKAIRNANRFLANAGKAIVDDSTKRFYLYEARAMRAWFHLELFLYFGPIPIVDHVISPEESELKRNTQAEVIQFITSELDTCAKHLPLYIDGEQPYRLTKGGCLTLKTVAYLNAHMYPEAAAAAQEVIDLNRYQLYYSPVDSSLSYQNLFLYAGELNNERIFSSQPNTGVSGTYVRLAPASASGTSNVNPTASLVNEYETRQGKTIYELGEDSTLVYRLEPNHNGNRDPRMAATILYPGGNFFSIITGINPFNSAVSNTNRLNASNSTRTGYWCRKYADQLDRSRTTNGTIDFMIYRYADVLLMRVEALVEDGKWNHPDVVKYLNMIRKRARMPAVDETVYNNEAKMRELYRRERRVELAFEGQRFFDIRRWKIAENVMNGLVEGATNPADSTVVPVETRHFNPERDYVWPIPLQEILGNKNMEQNYKY